MYSSSTSPIPISASSVGALGQDSANLNREEEAAAPSAEELNAARAQRFQRDERQASQPQEEASSTTCEAFDVKQVATWGSLIEQLQQDALEAELSKRLREGMNLHHQKCLRCLSMLVDCVVMWAKRSQAMHAAGRNWRAESCNLFQGQQLLDAIHETVNTFVSRLGPHQTYSAVEKKYDKLRPDDYPVWQSGGTATAATTTTAPQGASSPSNARQRKISSSTPQGSTAAGGVMPSSISTNSRRRRL